MDLDILDKKILNIVQYHFPLVSRPYEEIAMTLGITEQEVLQRLDNLKKEGIIKNIRGIFNYQQLGYSGLLCAAAVDPKDVNKAAEFINHYPGVTHNYLRNHYFNLWFTLITPSTSKAQAIIQEIKELAEVKDILEFPALNLFKIKVDFHFDEVENADRTR